MARMSSVIGRYLAAIGCGLAIAVSLPADAQTPDPALPDEVIVKMRTGQDVAGVLATHGLTVISRFGKRPIYRLHVREQNDADAKVEALRADPRVEFAERNYVNQTPERRRNVVWAIGGDAGTYAAQWAPTAMNLAEAHRISAGERSTVAVLDTGIDASHPVFAGRLVPGWDFVEGDGDPREEGTPAQQGYGHGTHVAGLVVLAAPRTAIMPLRVLDADGQGNLWVLAEAIMHAVDPDGSPYTNGGSANVINLSLGTTRETRLLNTAIELATCSDDDDGEDGDDYSDAGFDDDALRCNLFSGAVVVAAAGNSGSTTERQYPAAEGAEGALAVTASTQASRLADFANRGPWVSIAAPGEQITSALPDGQWGVWSGTSMAAPLTAGVAALIRSANPDWKPVDVTKRIMERSGMLCGTSLRHVDALAAVRDYVPAGFACR